MDQLRKTIKAMSRLERQFERTYKDAERRINRHLDRQTLTPDQRESRFKEMIKNAGRIQQGRLVKKGLRLQDRIQEMKKHTLITGSARA